MVYRTKSPTKGLYTADSPDQCVDPFSTIVWVECRPRGMTRADIEAHGDLCIDHHAPGDAGYGAGADRAFQASSVGQMYDWSMRVAPLGSLRDDAESWMTLHSSLSSAEAVAVGCADHNLAAALQGRTPADPALVLARHAASWEDAELAALLGRKPVPAADVLAGIEADRETLRTAPRVAILRPHEREALISDIASAWDDERYDAERRLAAFDRTHSVADLTATQNGTLRWAPAACSLEGVAYLAIAPARAGVPPTITIGGDTTPEMVEAFMDAGRRAVKAHREALDKAHRGACAAWVRYHATGDGAVLDAETEAETARIALVEFDAVCAKGRNGEGVYGDPARGFAGCYAPIERVKAELAFGWAVTQNDR